MDQPQPQDNRGTPPLRPRSVSLPPVDPPEPTAAGRIADRATDRLNTLAHELGNLLDGTIRYVALAKRGVSRANAMATGDQEVVRQLGVAQSALDRMRLLVREAASPCASTLARRLSEPRPLIEAILHACDVLRPLADERRIRIELDFSPRLVLTTAGPIYPVIANALRNAIEAIEHDGCVQIVGELSVAGAGRPEVQIDVFDDGPGPPSGVGARLFDVGFTTKQTGLGVGLALSREIIEELGGWIALGPRDPAVDGRRTGAHLAIRYPHPAE